MPSDARRCGGLQTTTARRTTRPGCSRRSVFGSPTGASSTPRFRLSYDFDERKKVESWGTEAILNALVLASDDRRHGLAARRRHSPGSSPPLVDAGQGREGGRLLGMARLRPPPLGGRRGALLRDGVAAIAVGTAPGYLKGEHEAETRAAIERLRRYLGSRLEGQSLHNKLFASVGIHINRWPDHGETTSADCRSGSFQAAGERRLGPALADRLPTAGWDAPGGGPGRVRHGTGVARAPARGSGPRNTRRRPGIGLAPRQPAAGRELGRCLAQQATGSEDPCRQVHVGCGDRVRDPGAGRSLNQPREGESHRPPGPSVRRCGRARRRAPGRAGSGARSPASRRRMTRRRGRRSACGPGGNSGRRARPCSP